MTYRPEDFQSPIGKCIPYCDTLGQCEFETVAAFIITHSQKVGHWKRVKNFHPDYRTSEMVQLGLLEENEDGYMLTEKALEAIHKRYPVKNESEKLRVS